MGYKHVLVPSDGADIIFNDSGFQVPNNPVIPFIEGDGVGSDIWTVAVKVFDAAVAQAYNNERKISWMEVYAGEKAASIYGDGVWLPDETIEVFKKFLVGMKGPLSGGHQNNAPSVNARLVKALDLYANVRPIKYYSGLTSPVKNPENINITIFRENVEGIYTGIEFEPESEGALKIKDVLKTAGLIEKIRFPENSCFALKSISKEGSERTVRSSIKYAIRHNHPSITMVHKGDILKTTEGNFVKWGYQVAKNEFIDKVITSDDCGGNAPKGMILLKDLLTDIFFQRIITSPEHFRLIVSLNQNGDYISGIVSAMAGGNWIIPGGNINFETGHGIFEVTHGTASKLAGFDKANPSSLILSGAMMLRHLGWNESAALIEKSFETTLKNKTVPYDLSRMIDGAREVKCSDFGQLLISNMK